MYDFTDNHNFAKKDSITIGENIIFKYRRLKVIKLFFTL